MLGEDRGAVVDLVDFVGDDVVVPLGISLLGQVEREFIAKFVEHRIDLLLVLVPLLVEMKLRLALGDVVVLGVERFVVIRVLLGLVEVVLLVLFGLVEVIFRWLRNNFLFWLIFVDGRKLWLIRQWKKRNLW